MRKRFIVSENCYVSGEFVYLPVICDGRSHGIAMDPHQALRLSAGLLKAAIGIIGELDGATLNNASNVYPLHRLNGASDIKSRDP